MFAQRCFVDSRVTADYCHAGGVLRSAGKTALNTIECRRANGAYGEGFDRFICER
jgi:hypothetical protein